MRTPPELPDGAIAALLREGYGLRLTQSTFLPLGADPDTFAFQVVADGAQAYFLKLRRGPFREVAARMPAFLYASGVRNVMAPLPTAVGTLWTIAHGFAWMLYPYFEGRDGYEVALSRAQWARLGETFRAVHSTRLPPDLAALVPRETYSPRWRDAARAFDREANLDHDDPAGARLAELWRRNRPEIGRVVERAAELARRLEAMRLEQVVCHADLHGANVLVGPPGSDDALTVVDWDEVILAPKERDLMSVGAGLFGGWTPGGCCPDPAMEEPWFSEGYGPAEVDPVALAYYRYERIVADFAAYADEIWNQRIGPEDREIGVSQLAGQFQPGHVVDLAHRTYQRLSYSRRL